MAHNKQAATDRADAKPLRLAERSEDGGKCRRPAGFD